jgi:hypothetical protein
MTALALEFGICWKDCSVIFYNDCASCSLRKMDREVKSRWLSPTVIAQMFHGKHFRPVGLDLKPKSQFITYQ